MIFNIMYIFYRTYVSGLDRVVAVAPPVRPRRAPMIERLVAIMARLRDPVDGCEWDRAQSFATIAPYTIEEAYEVADAIAREDMAELKDELGDLLLQVVFHSRMAEEVGLFALKDVVAAISDKMERRHPHIFGDADAPGDWEALKSAERSSNAAMGALDGVAIGLPGLLRADKLQKRAARVGFDWPDAGSARAKIDEELAEVAEGRDQSGTPRGSRRPVTCGRQLGAASGCRSRSGDARCGREIRAAFQGDGRRCWHRVCGAAARRQGSAMAGGQASRSVNRS